MSKKDKARLAEYLNHIVEAISLIEIYIDDMDEQQFFDDKKTQDAVFRNLEIIGEASNNISRYHAEFAAEHSQVPWRFAYECEMFWRTDISKLILRLCGTPSNINYQN